MLFVYLTLGLWLVLILYWIITAKISSQTKFMSELIPLLKLVGSALVIYLPFLTGGWLAKSLYRSNLWINVISFLLCAGGVSLAIWARHILGKNWSGKVVVQQEHYLVQEGPYRLIRHPIYSGALLAMIGTSLLFGYVFSFLYFIFSVFGLIRKSKQEEELLTKQFPNQYPQYQDRSKMLIPYLF